MSIHLGARHRHTLRDGEHRLRPGRAFEPIELRTDGDCETAALVDRSDR